MTIMMKMTLWASNPFIYLRHYGLMKNNKNDERLNMITKAKVGNNDKRWVEITMMMMMSEDNNDNNEADDPHHSCPSI